MVIDESNNLPFDRWLGKDLPQELWPVLSASTDMGWQKRSSGR